MNLRKTMFNNNKSPIGSLSQFHKQGQEHRLNPEKALSPVGSANIEGEIHYTPSLSLVKQKYLSKINKLLKIPKNDNAQSKLAKKQKYNLRVDTQNKPTKHKQRKTVREKGRCIVRNI